MKMRPLLFCLTDAPPDRQPQHLAGAPAVVSRGGATSSTRPGPQHYNKATAPLWRVTFVVLAAAAISACAPLPHCRVSNIGGHEIERCETNRCRDLSNGRFVECPR